VLYHLTRLALWVWLKAVYGLRIRGLRHVPTEGGAILASNHASYLDPPVVAAALLTRQTCFMAKEELFRFPPFAGFIRAYNAVPVKRGAIGRGTLESFVGLLRQEGRVLLMFPEGTRSTDGSLGPAKRGVGALCRMAKVPVVPILVTGTREVMPRGRLLPRPWGRIEVRFGPPVEWSDDELDASGDPSGALAARMMEEIRKLYDSDEPLLGFREGLRQVIRRSGPGPSHHIRVPHSGGTKGGDDAGSI
jgi:1-acyl-sn-glycerol-3-phosphate acyltransferase